MLKQIKSFAAITLATLALMPLSGTAYAKDEASKPTIVLVHGSFQDAHGWDRVVPKLEADGYKVVAITLPGRDGDTTPVESISSDTYRDKVLEAVNAESAPVVLVGHSFGGVTISNVAESAPKKIKALVYLAAYFPKDGESLQSLSKLDTDSKAGPFFQLSPDYKWASIKDAGKVELFANDATPEDQKLIAASLIKEPAAPTGMPVKQTAKNFGSVPAYYIRTTKDNTVGPSLQALMIKNHTVKKVYTVDAGHAAYVTQADKVAGIISEIAAK